MNTVVEDNFYLLNPFQYGYKKKRKQQESDSDNESWSEKFHTEESRKATFYELIFCKVNDIINTSDYVKFILMITIGPYSYYNNLENVACIDLVRLYFNDFLRNKEGCTSFLEISVLKK